MGQLWLTLTLDNYMYNSLPYPDSHTLSSSPSHTSWHTRRARTAVSLKEDRGVV